MMGRPTRYTVGEVALILGVKEADILRAQLAGHVPRPEYGANGVAYGPAAYEKLRVYFADLRQPRQN